MSNNVLYSVEFVGCMTGIEPAKDFRLPESQPGSAKPISDSHTG